MELRDPYFGNAMTLVPTSRPGRGRSHPEDDWLNVLATFEVSGHSWTDSGELLLAPEARDLASWLLRLCDVGSSRGSEESRGPWTLTFLEPNFEIQAWPHSTEIAFSVLLDHETRPSWAKELPQAEGFRLEFAMRVPIADARAAAATLSVELDQLGP